MRSVPLGRPRRTTRYGSFTRTISLPSGANPDDITANYDKGILTVNVAVPEQTTPQVKHIAV